MRLRIHAVAIALVLFRSLVFVFFEQAYFDSDQAVTGLMAKHLAEGRAFPLFFYGQHYMLAVEAWLAAPVFLVAGASVAALRAPLVAVNVATALLLLRILVRDAGVRPADALAASAFFIAAPPVAASRLIEPQGGNIEPLLYTLLLWIVRERPLWFGLVAGVGVLNREFTAYAILALLLVEAVNGTLLTRRNVVAKAQAAAVFAAVWVAVWALKPHADLLGPETASAELASGSTNLAFLVSKGHWQPADVGENIRWLLAHNLPLLFGARSAPLGAFINSALTLHDGWLWWPLCGALLWCAGRSVAVVSRGDPDIVHGRGPTPASARPAVPLYLTLTGLIAVFVYTFLSVDVRAEVLIRYTLLALFIPIGIVARYLGTEPRPLLRHGVLAFVALWSLVAVVNHGRLISEYVRTPPRSVFRELATVLEVGGWRYAWGDYWTAYHVTFLADEKVIVASREKTRMAEYRKRVEAERGRQAEIWREAGWCESPIRVAQWYVCVNAPPR